MSKHNYIKVWFITAILFVIGCSDEDVNSAEDWSIEVPSNFPAPVYSFQNNPITKEGFELGRMLFYENKISQDSTISCGSCHQPYIGFADPVHTLSVGVKDRKGIRNAPPIFNMAFQPFFFWDGGVTHLDFVPLNAFENELEMDETVPNILHKLNNMPKYTDKFKNVFGKDSIDTQQVLHALAQFTSSIVSASSPYDKYVRNEGYQLSDQEMRGMEIVKQKCSTCHASDLFTDFSFRNNGLDSAFEDIGRMKITENEEDLGKFKVPTLRNLELTAPYMHDGRFKTLNAVLDHYDTGVKNSATLDPALKGETRLGFALSDNEKSDIIAFLKTLTDREFTRDSRFFDPN